MQRRPKWQVVMFRRSTHLSGSRISLFVTDVWEGTTPRKIVDTRHSKCRKIGHIARACKSESSSTPTSRGQSNHATRRRLHQTHRVDGAEESQTESDPEFNDVVSRVHAVGVSVPKSYKVNLEINGTQLTMELDTGAGVSIVTEKTWVEELGKPELSSIDLPLEGYPNRPLRVLGQCYVDVKVHGKEAMLSLSLRETEFPYLDRTGCKV